MIDLFNEVIFLIVVLQNFMYIQTCLLLYYCNKLTEDLFCLAEQRNSCLSKKLVFINIYLYIYMLERLSGLKEKEYMYMLQVLYFKFNKLENSLI